MKTENKLNRASEDLKALGAGALLVTWSKDRKSINKVSYINIKKVRVAIELDDGSTMARVQKRGVTIYRILPGLELIQGFSELYKEERTQLLMFKQASPRTRGPS